MSATVKEEFGDEDRDVDDVAPRYKRKSVAARGRFKNESHDNVYAKKNAAKDKGKGLARSFFHGVKYSKLTLRCHLETASTKIMDDGKYGVLIGTCEHSNCYGGPMFADLNSKIAMTIKVYTGGKGHVLGFEYVSLPRYLRDATKASGFVNKGSQLSRDLLKDCLPCLFFLPLNNNNNNNNNKK